MEPPQQLGSPCLSGVRKGPLLTTGASGLEEQG